MGILNLRNAFVGACLSGITACTPPATNGTLGINGRIDNQSTSIFNNGLNSSTSKPGRERITIPINSPGGQLYAGNRIIAQIENADADITLQCTARAESMAAAILVTTQNVQRDARRNCNIMVHAPYLDMRGRTGGRVTSGLKLEQLKPYHDQVRANRSIQSVDIPFRGQGGITTVTFTRDEVIDMYQDLTSGRISMMNDFARATHFDRNDIAYLFARGDTDFNPNEAAFAGMIDTIDGRQPSATDLAVGEASFCARVPQVSICR